MPRPPTTIALDRAPATGEATAAATRPLPRDKKGPIDGPRVRADSLPPIRTLARLTETLNEMTLDASTWSDCDASQTRMPWNTKGVS